MKFRKSHPEGSDGAPLRPRAGDDRPSGVRSLRWVLPLLCCLTALGVHAAAPLDMQRVSVSTAELQSDESSYGPVDLTPDGQHVVFTSDARGWTGNQIDNIPDIFVRDRRRGFTELISVGTSQSGGRPPTNGISLNPSISDDGRFVAFASDSTTFAGATVAADTNNARDVFLRDRRGRTTRVSVTQALGQTNGASDNPDISGDGMAAAFATVATNMGADANAVADVYIYFQDPIFGFGSVFRVSEDENGVEPDGPSNRPSVSFDGRYVAFESSATNLHPDDTAGNSDVFVKDLLTGTVSICSLASDGSGSDGDSGLPAISPDGRLVAFVSNATNLVDDDFNDLADVFVHDLQDGTTERVSLSTAGDEGDADSGVLTVFPNLGRPSISADGNVVAFISDASSLDPDDGNGVTDVFIRRRAEGTTDRVSVTTGGLEGDLASLSASISADASTVGFTSNATNLIFDDTNGALDVFCATIGLSSSVNEPPIADAGLDQQVFESDPVVLDATASIDPEGAPLAYSWRQLEGMPVTLNSPSTPTPSFVAPLVPDFEQLVFEVSVSDGFNPAETAEVTIDVSASPPGILIGHVGDAFGNPIDGALVTVVRSDGTEASPQETDLTGGFAVFDVRAGLNTVTVYAAGFEPSVRTLVMPSQGLLVAEFTLFGDVASVEGQIRLADGRPLAGALVELLDADGNALRESQADGNGEYRLAGLDTPTLAAATSIRVSSPGIVSWIIASSGIVPAAINIRNFQYGSLRVTVDTFPRKLRRLLNGTQVDLLIGDTVVASNQATKRLRTLSFPNVPATSLRVRAINPGLSAGQAIAQIAPGRRPTRVLVLLRDPSNF